MTLPTNRYQFDLWMVFLVVTWIAASFAFLRGVAEDAFYPEFYRPNVAFIAPTLVAVVLTNALARRGFGLLLICLGFLVSNLCFVTVAYALDAGQWHPLRDTVLFTTWLAALVIIPTWLLSHISALPTTMNEVYDRHDDGLNSTSSPAVGTVTEDTVTGDKVVTTSDAP